jgi:peroxiredoxin family protein
MKTDQLALIVQSADPERLHYAAMLAASAAALDWEITVVVLGEALRKWVDGRLDDGLKQPAPSGATALLFATTAAFGRMTVLTCGADVAAAGLSRAAVLQRVDEIQGLPSILLRIREVGTKLYI